MMDQFFHLGHDVRFGRHHVFPIGDVDGASWQFIYYLPQDPDALPHFLDSYKIAVIAISSATDHYVEIILLVVEIGVFAPQIVLDPAAAQIWPRNGISNCAFLRNHANVFCSIDKDAITRQQFIALVQARNESIEEILELRNKVLRKITDLS